jgi:hypothetical protein
MVIAMAGIIETPLQLFAEIDHYFLDPKREKSYRNIIESRRQREDWFGQRLSQLFELLQEQDQLPDSWESEFRVQQLLPQAENEEWIDFMVMLGKPATSVYLEIKALYLGPQGSQPVYPSTYLSISQKRSSDGFIESDVRKLARIEGGERFCLLFVYPFPTKPDLWRRAMSSFIEGIKSKYKIRISEISNFSREEHSEFLYIAKLRVSFMGQSY